MVQPVRRIAPQILPQIKQQFNQRFVQPQINLARKSTGLLEKYRPNAPITQISKAITQPEFRPQFKTALNKSFEQYNINVGTPEQQKEKFRSMVFGFTGAEFGKVIPLASKQIPFWQPYIQVTYSKPRYFSGLQ